MGIACDLSRACSDCALEISIVVAAVDLECGPCTRMTEGGMAPNCHFHSPLQQSINLSVTQTSTRLVLHAVITLFDHGSAHPCERLTALRSSLDQTARVAPSDEPRQDASQPACGNIKAIRIDYAGKDFVRGFLACSIYRTVLSCAGGRRSSRLQRTTGLRLHPVAASLQRCNDTICQALSPILSNERGRRIAQTP